MMQKKVLFIFVCVMTSWSYSAQRQQTEAQHTAVDIATFCERYATAFNTGSLQGEMERVAREKRPQHFRLNDAYDALARDAAYRFVRKFGNVIYHDSKGIEHKIQERLKASRAAFFRSRSWRLDIEREIREATLTKPLFEYIKDACKAVREDKDVTEDITLIIDMFEASFKQDPELQERFLMLAENTHRSTMGRFVRSLFMNRLNIVAAAVCGGACIAIYRKLKSSNNNFAYW